MTRGGLEYLYDEPPEKMIREPASQTRGKPRYFALLEAAASEQGAALPQWKLQRPMRPR